VLVKYNGKIVAEMMQKCTRLTGMANLFASSKLPIYVAPNALFGKFYMLERCQRRRLNRSEAARSLYTEDETRAEEARRRAAEVEASFMQPLDLDWYLYSFGRICEMNGFNSCFATLLVTDPHFFSLLDDWRVDRVVARQYHTQDGTKDSRSPDVCRNFFKFILVRYYVSYLLKPLFLPTLGKHSATVLCLLVC
jgi:hypothetical protein